MSAALGLSRILQFYFSIVLRGPKITLWVWIKTGSGNYYRLLGETSKAQPGPVVAVDYPP